MKGRFSRIGDPVAFSEALEALFRQADAHPDPKVRELVLDVAEAVMRLHSEALSRIVALLRLQPRGQEVLARLRDDDVVGVLLADHGLLDEPAALPGAPAVGSTTLEARVEAALDRIRPYMHDHGGDVEILDVGDGAVRLRLQGACDGCTSSAITLRAGVEQILRAAVPELARIEVEGMAGDADPPPQVPTGFIPLASVTRLRGWGEVGRTEDLAFGIRHVLVDATPILLCTAFGKIYALRDRCPRGGGSLRDARLEAFLLVCPCHGERYDLRSGRSLADPYLSLELLPSAIEDGRVRVAVG